MKREEAIRELKIQFVGEYDRQRKAKDIAIKALEQQKTGHWIDGFGGCECSECGCLEAGYSNYCPNCGAKMESEGEV